MKLDENFSQQEFTNWIEEFVPDFSIDIRKVDVPSGFTGVKSINTLGESGLNVRVYIIETDADPSRRKVGLATDSFNLLKNYGSPNAIIAYYSKDEPLWRISLLTSTPVWSEGKIITKLSNPKRQSYILGSKAKIKTPHQYLLSKGKIIDFTDLKSRFSLEVVNKEFYKEISQAFTKLVSGLLKLPSTQDKSQINLEFAVRLIGRIIFCWFLREKKSQAGIALMPKELLSLEAAKKNEDYYHKILEPIFFEVLNKIVKSRKDDFSKEPFSSVPYLNGGLFSPQDDDYYKRTNGDLQSQYHNTLVIPDHWFNDFFEILKTYNFTIDENTSFDEELSIDPEMLGRIFENLLAEINPETGESARKSTGSYYTPRIIVDYMIDESLLLYLKEKAGVEENKLRSLISYDLEDDNSNPLNERGKDKIAQALSSVKILDPACGSGAFPIGALQKIVFILQQIDQDGQLWFKKQIENTPMELRKVLEREFQEKNFDYIRKLGIIRENIYGIDIQPIATEISRLRCFLTLVVDEQIDDLLDNRGIEPLPNLDFKFVTANTLVSLPSSAGSLNQIGLFEDDQGIIELKEVRDMFFNASGSERDQLKLQFVQTQNRMFQKLISNGFSGYADMTSKLTSWDPFSHKMSNWFDPEWMFGLKNGFDIVIGNPPWVSLSGKQALEDNRKSMPLLKKMYGGNTYMPNLYEYFILKSFDFLTSDGTLTLIVPDRLGLNESSALIRKNILTNHSLIDIVYRWEFEAIIADTMTFIVKNSINNNSDIKIRYSPESAPLEFSHEELINNENFSWRSYKNKANYLLVKKIGQNSEKLITYCKTTSGFGGKSELITDDRQNNSQVEVLKGKSISRYLVLKKYYFEFKDENITGRTRDKAKLSVREKLLLRKTGNTIIAVFDQSGTYPEQSLYFSYYLDDSINPLYLLALLNSKLMTWYYRNELITNIDSTPQIKQFDLDSFPIVKAEKDVQDSLEKLALQIKSCIKEQNEIMVKNIEEKINRIVYQIYNLKSDESALIEREIDS